MSISLKNVYFTYPDAPHRPVLNIPCWTVAPQEQVFVHGPSGGGKSTLLNLLSGMLVPSQEGQGGQGEVSILGKRLDKMSQRQLDRFRANHIGYVFQQLNLIPYLSSVENILLATYFSAHKKARVKSADVEKLLTKLNISPDDWSKQIAKLSTGQQQRVAIARALINKPELLIADEPTSSLDQDNRDNFMSVLVSLVAENKITLVFVSHDKSLSRYFNRIDALSDISCLSGARGCS
ncbi:ABC transporter ATP-binding protein [Aliikangiella coralliicola]|uniref:ABC transporter ATP-binding protein n=1 Tax=Aliikangiella coralliicola TaxID=2592383 RepID=A0A545UGH8_9GAMM|nr:ABC transporter ATP-binding protein [Aliikangiella coralliicola]TQV88567.1 ABC transporter ATP-binding protein [Aliikangiella coralliicola]